MDEENLARLLQAFSNCNYIEFVKIFSMIHGFDATFEFLRNALTTIPFMAFKKKFWNFGSDEDKTQQQQQQQQSTHIPKDHQINTKKRNVRSTWEEDDEQEFLYQKSPPQIYYDSDHDYHTNKTKYTNENNNNIKNNKNDSNNKYKPVNNKNSNNNLKHNKKRYKNSNYNINNTINTSIKNIQELPFEIIIYIFSFLIMSDIYQTSFVSREWNRYAFVATTELNFDNRKSLSVDIVNKKIYKHSDYLKKIQFYQSKIIGYSSVRMIVDHCRNIQDIEFHFCPLINDTEIDLVCTMLPKLGKIVLHSECLSIKTFDSLLKATQLTDVELGGFSRIPVEAFSRLTEINGLQSLDVSKITKKTICQSIRGCKSLLALRLATASESKIRVLPFLNQLEMLTIDEWELETAETTSQGADTSTYVTTVCSQESDGSYLKFLERCTRLEKFEITGASDFIIRSLNSLLCVSSTLKVLDMDMVLGGGNSNVESSFRKVLPELQALESLFISKFSLNGEAWEVFALLPNLTVLSLCCNRLNGHTASRGIEHISRCLALEKLSLINSTEYWIDISERPFSGLLALKDTLVELRLGGSRGGGWTLNEGVFQSLGRMSSLKVLDLSNSHGITEQCLSHLSQCSSLEFLEGSVKIDEQIIQNTIADWCSTSTLINCPTLRKVSFDIKLPSSLNSEISCPNSSNRFNLITKISNK